VFEQDDAVLNKVVDELRTPVRVDPALDARVMATIEAEAHESFIERTRRWLTEPRLVAITPLRAMAMAAGVVAIATLAADRGILRVADSPGAPVAAITPAASPATLRRDTTVIRFVFVAPKASSVSLVGDFNGWDRARTPLQAIARDGIWTVALPLPPGRHRYAFIVDGTRWMVDPSAPRAVEDDFGSPNSVVTVGENIT
jgi:hypothetical protein